MAFSEAAMWNYRVEPYENAKMIFAFAEKIS